MPKSKSDPARDAAIANYTRLVSAGQTRAAANLCLGTDRVVDILTDEERDTIGVVEIPTGKSDNVRPAYSVTSVTDLTLTDDTIVVRVRTQRGTASKNVFAAKRVIDDETPVAQWDWVVEYPRNSSDQRFKRYAHNEVKPAVERTEESLFT